MIFAIIASKRPELIGPVIEAKYPGDSHIKLSDNEWLVVDENITSSGVARKLTITGPEDAPNAAPVSSALVIGVTGYGGRQPANVWEWFRAKLETD